NTLANKDQNLWQIFFGLQGAAAIPSDTLRLTSGSIETLCPPPTLSESATYQCLRTSKPQPGTSIRRMFSVNEPAYPLLLPIQNSPRNYQPACFPAAPSFLLVQPALIVR